MVFAFLFLGNGHARVCPEFTEGWMVLEAVGTHLCPLLRPIKFHLRTSCQWGSQEQPWVGNTVLLIVGPTEPLDWLFDLSTLKGVFSLPRRDLGWIQKPIEHRLINSILVQPLTQGTFTEVRLRATCWGFQCCKAKLFHTTKQSLSRWMIQVPDPEWSEERPAG